MKIDKTFNIKQVKEQFSSQFPYLKIEFYNDEHEKNEGSKIDNQLKETVLLSELNPKLSTVEVQLDPEMTVSDFEHFMQQDCGLNIQVFRKSNDLWLQTSSTDSWTLEKQNGKGERSTHDYDIDPISIADFDVD